MTVIGSDHRYARRMENWRAASKVLSHRGLNLMALACLVGSAVALVLYFADPRELLGVPLWEKPLKIPDFRSPLLSNIFLALLLC